VKKTKQKSRVALSRTRYWLAIFAANFNGRIGVHSIRHPIYRHVFKIGLPTDSIIYCGCRFFDPWGVKIGNHSIIGDHAFLDGRRGLTIGNNVNIASEVRIYTLEHDPESPTFAAKGGSVVIKDWVYVGSRVTILPGITIEEGAVVATGAVVTKDVEPWTIVGGVPAKFIKERPQVKYVLDTKNKALFQ
jgi:acetyltransferase-like isoleucine patch superfamily enzyme